MSKKILLVEDDKFLSELISKKLISEGFVVNLAFEGEGALDMAKKDQPDLILLDIILPGMDGFEILTKLKQDAGLATIPVMMISNLMQQEDIDKALSLGAVEYLVKSQFTSDEIMDKIKSVVK